MEQHKDSYLLKSTLNGSLQKGNFVWAGAMNLAWTQLEKDIIKEPLDLLAKDDLGKRMVLNFKDTKFTTKDLVEESYYVKSGYGQNTVEVINKQCRAKFPKKTFGDLELKLNPTDIISYAYFVKEVSYLKPFVLHPHFHFQGHPVKGFKATTQEHRGNLKVCHYADDNEFILKLLLKEKNEELFVVKGMADASPQDVLSAVMGSGKNMGAVTKDEQFQMPMLELDITREYSQLEGSPVLNPNFKQYRVQTMVEKIKFRMDEVGAKVENEAVIMLSRMCVLNPNKRSFLLNSPFWVVMRESEKQPYFILHVSNTEFMHPQ